MKTEPPKPTKASAPAKERLAFLEEAYRHALDSLEMAVSLGVPATGRPPGTITQVLNDSSARLRKILKFKAIAFFLVHEPGADFHLARCSPPAKSRLMEEEMRRLVEGGSAAWALQRNRPVFTTPSQGQGQLLLHSVATASRIRGIFLGWLGQDIGTITDLPLALTTIVLRGCASLLEGLELYGLLRKANSELTAKVRALEDSQRSLTREIEHRRKAERELKHQALHDALTGLANRVLMHDRIHRAFQHAKRRENACFAVAFLDLDKFKQVNDTLGHDAGDKLLVRVGERLIESVRQVDTVARFGGDEFVIFLEELTAPSEALRVMKRVRQALERPFDLDGHPAAVTGSFGLAFGPGRLTNPDRLIKNAGMAMHMAKEAGRNRIRVFSPKMNGLARDRAATLSGLRRAVLKERIQVLFKPTMSVRDMRLDGFEAIPAWRSKERGELRGDELAALATKEGVAWALWRASLGKALECLRKWRTENPDFADLVVSMKLAQAHLPQSGMARAVLEGLERAGLPGSALRLEIAVQALVQGGEMLVSQLSVLKERGVKLSAGDFGERFFSFQSQNPGLLDSMTIDSSRLADQAGGHSIALLVSLMSVAKALDLSVTAARAEILGIEGMPAGRRGSDVAAFLTARQALSFAREFRRHRSSRETEP